MESAMEKLTGTKSEETLVKGITSMHTASSGNVAQS
jgi:hypothetical protein